jgi:hypothetical protein
MVTATCSVALYALLLLWRRVNRRYQNVSNTEPWLIMPEKSKTFFMMDVKDGRCRQS